MLFIGNALWNQDQLLNEPSLQGSVFAVRPSQFDKKFNVNGMPFAANSGRIKPVGFDALLWSRLGQTR